MPDFIALYKTTASSPAWRATSHGARSLYLALRGRYNTRLGNHVYLSTRSAAAEIGSHRDQISRWYRELEYYGFIVMVSAGCLGVDGRGKAPHWRLTEDCCLGQLPTRDFLQWNGIPFATGQKQNPVPETRDSVARKPGTPVARKPGTVTSKPVPETRDITSLTTRVARAGSDLEGDVCRSDVAGIDAAVEPPAHAPMGHNAGPPLDQDDLTIPAFLRRTSLH